jgi:uncharacterized protein (DUF1697 family)
MIYVALLRGINVGGNSKVEMSRLKAVFENLGCNDVATYINSGNVIFRDDRAASELTELIESAIAAEFGAPHRLLLRDHANLQKLCADTPDDWVNDKTQKTDVLFLWEEVDDPDLLGNISWKPEIETVRYIDGALVWNIPREFATRASEVKLIGTELYKRMTIRNVNTVRKLLALMDKLEY